MKPRRYSYFKHPKKLKLTFFLLYLCFSSVLFFTLYMQETIFHKQLAYHQRLYGAWQGAVYHITDENRHMLEQHALFSYQGTMDIYGEALQETQYIGKIGAVDPPFPKQTQLTLKKGHFPEATNEIAMEAFVLDELGRDYSLPQQLTIAIKSPKGSVLTKAKTFTLCGIVNNYSANWNSDGDLANLFIAPSPSLQKTAVTNMFLIPKKGYEDILSQLRLKDNQITENKQTEFTYHPYSPQNLPYTIIAIASIAMMITLLWAIWHHFMQRQRREFQILSALGFAKKALLLDALSLQLRCSLGSILLVAFPCFLLSMSLPAFLIAALILLSTVVVTSIFLSFLLRNIQLPVNTFSKQTLSPHTSAITSKPVTITHMVLRSLRLNKRKTILQILTLSAVLILLFHCISVQAVHHAVAAMWNREQDIIVTSTTPGKELQTMAVQASHMQTIHSLHVFHEKNDITMTWESQKRSALYRHPNSHRFFYGQEDKQLHPTMLCVSTLSDIPDTILAQATPHLEKKAFADGKKVILYLPDILMGKDTYSLQASATFKDQGVLLHEDTLHVNDWIHLQDQDGTSRRVQIGAIIRKPLTQSDGFQSEPYKILASNKLFSTTAYANKMEIRFDTNQDVRGNEERLSSLASRYHLHFTNNSVQKRLHTQQETQLQLLIAGFVWFIFLLLPTIYSIFAQQQLAIKQQLLTVFHQLGLATSYVLRILLLESLWISTLTILCASLLSLPIKILYWMSLTAYQDFHWLEIFSAANWNWWLYGLVVVFTYLISLLFTFLFFYQKQRQTGRTTHT